MKLIINIKLTAEFYAQRFLLCLFNFLVMIQVYIYISDTNKNSDRLGITLKIQKIPIDFYEHLFYNTVKNKTNVRDDVYEQQH